MSNTVLRGVTILVWLVISCLSLPGQVSADDFSKAVQAMDQGQDEQAIGLFSSYLSRKPQTYEALVNRGTAFARNRRIHKAVNDWSSAVEIAPIFAYSLYIDDVIRVLSPKNSLIKYVANIELYPEKAASVTMAGATLLDLGLKSEAIDLFRRSIPLTKNPLFKTDLEYWIKNLDPSQKKVD